MEDQKFKTNKCPTFKILVRLDCCFMYIIPGENLAESQIAEMRVEI